MRATLLLLLFAPGLTAAPPALTAPSEVKGEVSAFVVVRAATTAKWIKYVPLDPGLSVFPSDLLADKTVTVVVAAKAGRYRVLAYTGNDDGGAEAVTTLVIGTSPVPDPPKDPPKDPPPDSQKFHLKIVRNNGPPSPAHEALMALPAWAEVGKPGIDYSENVISELPAAVQQKLAGQTLPVVTYWTPNRDNPKLIDFAADKAPRKMPQTNDEIRALLK